MAPKNILRKNNLSSHHPQVAMPKSTHLQCRKEYDKELRRMIGRKQKKREKFQMNVCGTDFERASTSRISF